MKKFTILLSLLLMFAVAASAQIPAKVEEKAVVANCSIDQSGNYVALTKVQAQPTLTTKTYTDSKKVVHKIWLSPKGREFYTRVSKTSGKEYRIYLMPDPGKPIIQ